MGKSNQLWQDQRDEDLQKVADGIMPPDEALTKLVKMYGNTFTAYSEAEEEVLGALKSNFRLWCNNCGGTGELDAPFSGDDPGCPECSGEGSICDVG